MSTLTANAPGIANVSRENVNFSKVKFIDNSGIAGGIEAEYTVESTENDELSISDHTVKSYGQRHPDCEKALNKLRHYLAKNLRLLEGSYLLANAIKKEKVLSAKKLDKIADTVDLGILNLITVTGISISGSDELLGVIISGKIENQYGSNSALNSSRIVFSQDSLGYELEVESVVDELQDLAFGYLFLGKRAQGDLFHQEE